MVQRVVKCQLCRYLLRVKKERDKKMCVARIESHLFDLFGALQVEMLIFFWCVCSKEDCNFTLFTKLNSMIDLSRIATLGSLILNAMHFVSFVYFAKACGEKRLNAIEVWAVCRYVRDFETFRFICANIHRGKICV